MIDEKLKHNLDGIRVGILLYAPVLMYLFLRRREERDGGSEKFNMKDIIGKSVSEWPDEVKKDFERLFRPDKKLIDLQREFVYFLIFYFFGILLNFLEDRSDKNQTLILDYLFGIFGNGEMPWLLDLDIDAFDKYVSSGDGFLVKFSSELSKISGEEDALFLYDFIAETMGIVDFLIKPSIERLMSNN